MTAKRPPGRTPAGMVTAYVMVRPEADGWVVARRCAAEPDREEEEDAAFDEDALLLLLALSAACVRLALACADPMLLLISKTG